MEIYKCLTHGLVMKIDGNRRDISGAVYGQTPQCHIPLLPKTPQEGTFGKCVVVKEK